MMQCAIPISAQRHSLALLVVLALCVCANALAQTTTPHPNQSEKSLAATTLPAIAAPKWDELSPSQQNALMPLKLRWDELGEGQRRKWIAIVKNFASLSAEDQQKVQDRMASWASLNPAQRERARENFANSKLAAPTDKTGSWEEYMALPSEEREKLASQAMKKRPSAAKKPKTSPTATHPSLFPSPASTAGTPWGQSQQMRGNLRDWLNPNTLLPLDPEQ